MESQQPVAGPSSRPSQPNSLQCSQCRAMAPVAVFLNYPDMTNPTRCLRCARPYSAENRWREMLAKMSKKIKKARPAEAKRTRGSHRTYPSARNLPSGVLPVSLGLQAGSSRAVGTGLLPHGDKVPLELSMLKEPLRSAVWLKIFYRQAEGNSIPQGYLYKRYVASLSPYPPQDPRYRHFPLGKIPSPLNGVEFIANVPVVMPSVKLSREGYLCIGIQARSFDESQHLWDRIYLKAAQDQLERQAKKSEQEGSYAPTDTSGDFTAGRLSAKDSGTKSAQSLNIPPVRPVSHSQSADPCGLMSPAAPAPLSAPPFPTTVFSSAPCSAPTAFAVRSTPLPAIPTHPSVPIPLAFSVFQDSDSSKAGVKTIDLSGGDRPDTLRPEPSRTRTQDDPFSLQPPAF